MPDKVSSSSQYSKLGVKIYCPECIRKISGNTRFIKHRKGWDYVHEPSKEYVQKLEELNNSLRRKRIIKKDLKKHSAILISSIFAYFKTKHYTHGKDGT